MFPRVLKSTMGSRALRYQVPLLWTSSQFGFWRHTLSLQLNIRYQWLDQVTLKHCLVMLLQPPAAGIPTKHLIFT